MLFLSTLSLRRATVSAQDTPTEQQHFYPRSPCGERRPKRPKHQTQTHFYPRSPCGERRISARYTNRAAAISIHALLAESDVTPMVTPPSYKYFYPRSPCGERHARRALGFVDPDISIHALLAESDSKSAQNSGALLRIWNKFYGDCIFMLTGKAVFYPFCPCFFHIFWCEGSGNFMIAFPSH